VFILIKLLSGDDDDDYNGPVINTFLVSAGKLESPGFTVIP